MRKLIHIAISLLVGLAAFSQNGNEWINYSQTYYKFPIVVDGVYRITYNDLSNAGFPVTTVDPRNIQIFGHEREIALNVEGENDGIFNTGDFIEFYAHKADGRLDSMIYSNPLDHPNKFFNFYNDTIYYFITWNNLTNNKRLAKSTSENYASYTSQPYCYVKARNVKSGTYSYDVYNGYLSDPRYLKGEGYGDYQITRGGTYIANVSLSNIYLAAGGPQAYAYSASKSSGYYQGNFENRNNHIRISYSTAPSVYNTIFEETRFGTKVDKLNFNIPNNQLYNGNYEFRYQLIDDLAEQDRYSFSELEINYPHTFNFEGQAYFEFNFLADISQPFVRIDASNLAGTNLKIMGTNNNNILVSAFNDGGVRFVIPNNTPSDYVFYAQESIRTVSGIKPVSLSGLFQNYLAEANENNLIMISHKKLWSKAIEYAQYRASLEGGSYNVILVDVDELYDQFGEGVQKSSLAIRRFLKGALDSWSDVQGVFILGKGIHNSRHITNGQLGTRWNTTAYQRCLIPVLGAPATDNMFTLGLNGDWNIMDIPIGRYSAQTPADVELYLNKIKEYEAHLNNPNYTIEDKEWQKKVLHFIGGGTDGEQQSFLNTTRRGKVHIENVNFGANVEEYLKKGSEPVNPTDLYILTEKIRNGVAMIQLFGHSSYSAGFDTNLDNPNNWGNKGKYPVVVANGCNSGDLYNTVTLYSNSEEYVITKDNGAIAYISTTTSGYDLPLGDVTEDLYKNISILNYGGTLGSSNANAISGRLPFNSFPIYTGSIGTFNLHGDPMIKLYPHELPEFVIPDYGISFTPENPTLQDQTITVNVDVYNIGMATNEEVIVELVRTYPNGVDSVYTQTLNGIKNKTTVTFDLPLDPAKAEGINRITAKVDIPSFIDEVFDEFGNNQASKDLFILINGVIPIIPYEFAIIGNEENLYAATINPEQKLLTYVVELDTTDLFNSPISRYKETTSNGGTISIDQNSWLARSSNSPSPLVFQDSMVYFWRVSVKGEENWRESSFQYIEDKYGWGQAHFFQFKNNEFTKLEYDKNLRTVNFDFTDARLTVNMYSNPSNGTEFNAIEYKIFNKSVDRSGGGQLGPAINIAVINPDDLEPWGTPKWFDSDGDGTLETLLNPTHFFGQFNEYGSGGRRLPDRYFTYVQSDQAQLQSIETLIDAVPEGHYILFYTFVRSDYASWDALYPNLYNVFQSIGADQMVSGQEDNVFAILYLKGEPSLTKQFYSPPVLNNTEFYSYETTFPITPVGIISAPKAGPAKEWNTIYWQQNPKEVASSDSTHLYVYGVDFSDNETLLIDTVMTLKDSIINLEARINAQQYPYLRLKARFEDKVGLTPAHLQRWQILYQPIPEAAVEPSLGLYYTAVENKVQEGEDVELSVAFKNISSIDMDSILIKYWITDRFNKNTVLRQVRKAPLLSEMVMKDTLKFNTLGYHGQNTLWFEINPIDASGRKDQLEQHHFNNYYQRGLNVIRDKENPILDVTFDGARIFDGDIVSPSPKILIRFKDENKFLRYSEDADTALVRVSIIYPGQIAEQQIYFKNNKGERVLDWSFGAGAKNEFLIEYNPENLADGIYKLRVQGSDKSLNISGDLSYEVEFEVINESTITYFYNYPNPFSTRTQFVFTLTGNEIPDEITIQIITITGKVVKHITAADLGPIRIGKNVTQYYWNGTDDFGDVLANGVYLYKVTAKIKGESVEHRETSKDNLFKHQFGKLYIMR
jgi:hypothetical protein